MVIKESGNGLQNRTAMQKTIDGLKFVWDYVNVFDIPQLARDISCDVKHIRKCYDDSSESNRIL